MNKLRRMLLTFILFLLIPCIVWGEPFLVCDPYNGLGSVTDVEVMYKPFEQETVVVTGTYTVSENNIILLDLTDQYTSDPRYFRARWKVDGNWSRWSDTGVMKGKVSITPSKGTGTITPGKGTGSISPYYDDTFFIFLYEEESNYMDLLFSPIYGINNLTNMRMR